MRTIEEIIFELNGDKLLSREDCINVAKEYAHQFKVIKTTDGEEIIYDDRDYDLLRSIIIFRIKRGNLCTKTVARYGNRSYTEVAKLILNPEDSNKWVVRYKDGNTLNICRDNIELMSRQQAQFKTRKPKNNTSGYKGVSWNKNAKKYGASIRVGSKSKHLGYFGDVHAAAIAYNEGAIKYFGKEYANLNVIETIHKQLD